MTRPLRRKPDQRLSITLVLAGCSFLPFIGIFPGVVAFFVGLTVVAADRYPPGQKWAAGGAMVVGVALTAFWYWLGHASHFFG